MALPFTIKHNPTFLGVMVAKDIIRQIARGERCLGLLSGGTGVGKTYWVRRICHQHGIKGVPEDRPNNKDALVRLCWLYRDMPVVLWDECDHLLRQETAINTVKGMNGDPRVVSHWTVEAQRNEEWRQRGSARYSPNIPPCRFCLDKLCRQLMLSNLNYTDEKIISQLPMEHWDALISRGLDPVYIPTDGHEGRDLFEFTVWCAVEDQMLRGLQFRYEVARDAFNAYLRNIARLKDISPRRLVLLARAIQECRGDKLLVEGRINNMLSQTEIRPRFQLEESMVQILTWPKKPAQGPRREVKSAPRQSRPARPSETAAEPVVRPQPTPVPATAESKPFIDVSFTVVEPILEMNSVGPLPEPTRVLTLPPPEPPKTLGQAIEIIYRSRQYTCEGVAEVLRRCNLGQLDDEDFRELAERLEGCADWDGEHNALAQAFCIYEKTAHIVFGTSHGVLIYEDGDLRVLTWPAVVERIAPQLAEQAKKDKLQRAEQRGHEILDTKLPAKRKLRKMQLLLGELLSLPGAKVNPELQTIVDRICAMTEDAPQFADCTTFRSYIERAAEIMQPPQQDNLPVMWVSSAAE